MKISHKAGPSRHHARERGAAMPEYALILILVGLIAVPALGFLGLSLKNSIDCQRNRVDGVAGPCAAAASSTSSSSSTTSSGVSSSSGGSPGS
jgi:Flp pilus assembly pilin Flp